MKNKATTMKEKKVKKPEDKVSLKEIFVMAAISPIGNPIEVIAREIGVEGKMIFSYLTRLRRNGFVTSKRETGGVWYSLTEKGMLYTKSIAIKFSDFISFSDTEKVKK